MLENLTKYGVLFHMPYDTCVTYKPTAKIVYKGVEIG